MYRNLDRALTQVLKHEGGYVNHPNDPGGPTNLGVTLANFKRYVSPAGTIEDLKKLTAAQARTVFERQFWDAVRGNALPGGVDFAVFDFGVNSGPSRAIKFLQKVVGVVQDGTVGPDTLKAIEGFGNNVLLVQRLCDARLTWLRTLKTWATFGRGWEKRVNDVRKNAAAWAAEPLVETTPPVFLPGDTDEPSQPPVYIPVGEPSIAFTLTFVGLIILLLVLGIFFLFF